MKIKLKFATILFMLVSAGSLNPALAQKTYSSADKSLTPEGRAEMQNNMMKTGLQLSQDQYQKVSALNLEYAKKIQTIIDGGGSKLAKAKKAKPILKEKDEKLKNILSAEQYQLYRDTLKEKLTEMKKNYSGKKK